MALIQTIGSYTAYFLPVGANSVTQVAPYPFTFSFSNYYLQPAVKFSSIPDTAIKQIVAQKYIATLKTQAMKHIITGAEPVCRHFKQEAVLATMALFLNDGPILL